MDNHVHLLLQVAEISVSKITQNFAFRYTQFINRKQHETGHLFQGPFKSLVVDADNYLLVLVQYIRLNAVRAKLVSDPPDYGWPSICVTPPSHQLENKEPRHLSKAGEIECKGWQQLFAEAKTLLHDRLRRSRPSTPLRQLVLPGIEARL